MLSVDDRVDPRHTFGHVAPNAPRDQYAARDEYAARDPTDSVLARTIRRHIPRFLELPASDGHWTLPGFVEYSATKRCL